MKYLMFSFLRSGVEEKRSWVSPLNTQRLQNSVENGERGKDIVTNEPLFNTMVKNVSPLIMVINEIICLGSLWLLRCLRNTS